MSDKRKEKVIQVDNVIIHTKNIEIINNQKKDNVRRDPWEFFWGRSPRYEINQQKEETKELETDKN